MLLSPKWGMLLHSVLHYRILVKIRHEKAKTLVQNAITLNTKQVWNNAYCDLAWHTDNGLCHAQKGILKQWFSKAGNFFRNLGKMGKRNFFFKFWFCLHISIMITIDGITSTYYTKWYENWDIDSCIYVNFCLWWLWDPMCINTYPIPT